MDQLNPQALLRAGLLTPQDDVLAASKWPLARGWRGSAEFREYRLYLPALAQGISVTLEFSPLDAGGCPGCGGRSPLGCRFRDRVTVRLEHDAPCAGLAGRSQPQGPWETVPQSSLRTENDQSVLEAPFDSLPAPRFFRTRTPAL